MVQSFGRPSSVRCHDFLHVERIQFASKLLRALIIDGPAIIGIYQAEIPDFGSLVDVGNTRSAVSESASAPAN